MPKIYLIGIIVFVALGYLTMGEWNHLIITQEDQSNVIKDWYEETIIWILLRIMYIMLNELFMSIKVNGIVI